MQAPLPSNETARLDALKQYHVLDTAPESAFDELTILAAQICQTPIASITFIDEKRQWFKSSHGIEVEELSRSISFCAHTINGNDLLLVPDATRDERFRDNPLVTSEPGVRFYAGMPLVTPEGLSVGSLCVADNVARELSEQQLQSLRTLGHQVVAQLELRPDLSGTAVRQIGTTQSRKQRLAQRQTEQQTLHAHQQRNAMLVELSLNAIIVMDASGKITDWNPAAQTIFGHSRAEVVGRDLANVIVPPALRERHNAGLARHLRTGESRILGQRIEMSALHADGREFPIEMAITRYESEEGPIFLSSLSDITARKRSEAAMQRAADELELHVIERTAELSHANAKLQLKIEQHQRAEERVAATAQRLSGVLASISDAFIALDDQWNFTYVNDQALRLMKKTRAELLGREFWQGFLGTDNSVLADELRRAVESGQPITLESYFASQKSWLEIHAYPSKEGLSIYFQDISARRANQFALEEAKREADAANAAKSEFLGRVSHELRTPLNAILGFGQILDRQDLTPMQSESVSYILKSGQHLLELINEVLDISRVESGRIELNLAPVSVGGAIAESCALMRPLADARSITLRLPPASASDSFYVCADPQRFAQIMINLLSNAIKYNFECGEVEISWQERGDDRLQISVRDSGPGISERDLSRLFVPFERGIASDSTIEGTGLGLALALGLVEAMGGVMKVESALGRGSTFSFELPRTQISTKEIAVVSDDNGAAENIQSACAYRVLCIEDNPSNLRLIELLMATRPEISLISARRADEGLRLAHGHEPDLILLDLNLPDMHGAQVLKRFQQSAITRDIPVIVISADATKTQIEALLDAGATQYLTKPLDMKHLLKTLNKFLQPI